MSLRYKIVERGQPGVVGGGEKQYYAQMVTNGEVKVDELVKEIEKFSALSEPDIRGVIIALENVIQNKLADSKIVRMERIGSFYPTLSSEGSDAPEKVNQSNIRRVGVNYRPGERIIQTLRNAGFTKAPA